MSNVIQIKDRFRRQQATDKSDQAQHPLSPQALEMIELYKKLPAHKRRAVFNAICRLIPWFIFFA